MGQSPVKRLDKAEANRRWKDRTSASKDALVANWDSFQEMREDAGPERDQKVKNSGSVHLRLLNTTSWSRGARNTNSPHTAFGLCFGTLLEEASRKRLDHRYSLLTHKEIRKIRKEIRAVINATFREVTGDPTLGHPFEWWDLLKVSNRALPITKLELGERHTTLHRLKASQTKQLRALRFTIERKDGIVNNPGAHHKHKLVSTEMSHCVDKLMEVGFGSLLADNSAEMHLQ